MGIDVAKANANVDFAAVNEQSGLRAGDGGFDINVGGKTDLVGGAITSTQQAVVKARTNSAQSVA